MKNETIQQNTFKKNDLVVVMGTTAGNRLGKALIFNPDYKGFEGKAGALVRFIDNMLQVGFVLHKEMRPIQNNTLRNSGEQSVRKLTTLELIIRGRYDPSATLKQKEEDRWFVRDSRFQPAQELVNPINVSPEILSIRTEHIQTMERITREQIQELSGRYRFGNDGNSA